MDFAPNESQAAVAELAAQILGDGAGFERTRELEAEGAPYDHALWSRLAEANLLGVALDEAHGGQGMGFLALCLLLEEAGARLAPLPLFDTLVMGALAVQEFGTAEQRARLLPAVAEGAATLTAALAEPGEAFARRHTNVSARREGDGFVLDGEKQGVPYAATARAILVPARADEGLGVFLVTPEASGVTLESQETTAHEPWAVLHLRDVRVAAEEILAPPPRGPAVLDWLAPRAATALAAVASGVAREGLRRTAAYTGERKQFGRTIGSFQGVSLRAADAYIDAEAMRLTMLQAAWRIDQGLPAEQAAAVARWWACQGGHRVAHTAQHLHGGIGADVDYPIHRYFLAAKQLSFRLGSASAQLAGLGGGIAERVRGGASAAEALGAADDLA